MPTPPSPPISGDMSHTAAGFMRAVIDALSAHIAVLDHTGTIQLVNTAWCEFAIANHLPDQRMGLGQNYLSLCETANGSFSDEASEIAHGIREVMEGRRDLYTLQYPCHSPIEQRWFLVRMTRFHLNHSAWVVIAHENITELWRKSEELRLLNQDLQDVTYSISHDLRSPLRGIDYLAQWVLEDAGVLLPDNARDDLHTLRHRISRMDGMLDGILTYTQIGQEQAPIEVIHLAELVQELFSLFTTPPGFKLDYQTPLPVIRTPKAPLALVLRNLLDNAIKHHHRQDGHVKLSAQYHDPMVEFCIADNGPGIPESAQTDIFQPFRTLQSIDTMQTSGMGLALVKKMLDRYGGTIRVDSTLGEGSCFYVTWPAEHYHPPSTGRPQ